MGFRFKSKMGFLRLLSQSLCFIRLIFNLLILLDSVPRMEN